MESMSLMGNTGSGLRAWSKGGWPIQCTSGHVSERLIRCARPLILVFTFAFTVAIWFFGWLLFFLCVGWLCGRAQVGRWVQFVACPVQGKCQILGDINRCQSWVLAFLMLATKTRRRKEKVFVITFHS